MAIHRNKAATALKQVVLKHNAVSILYEFSDALSNGNKYSVEGKSFLTSIYHELINVGQEEFRNQMKWSLSQVLSLF